MKILGAELKSLILDGINDLENEYLVTADFAFEKLQTILKDDEEYDLYQVMRKLIFCTLSDVMPIVTELMKGYGASEEMLDKKVVENLGYLMGDFIKYYKNGIR